MENNPLGEEVQTDSELITEIMLELRRLELKKNYLERELRRLLGIVDIGDYDG